MNRLNKSVIIGSAALLLISSLTACSHRYRDPEYRATKMTEWIADELELNTSQKEKLSALSKQMLQSRKLMREKVAHNKDELKHMLTQASLDQKKILGMVRSHTDAMNEQAPEIVAAMAAFYNTLTAEQRQELRAHMEKMHKRHGGRHYFGHHG